MNLGSQRNLVTVENPGAPAADGDGGFTLTYAAASQGQWWAAISTASARVAERVFSSTITGHANYILTGRFHPEIGLQTRLTWTDRAGAVHVSNVLDVNDTNGAGVETVALVSEIAT
jgi:head-tail adaptor